MFKYHKLKLKTWSASDLPSRWLLNSRTHIQVLQHIDFAKMLNSKTNLFPLIVQFLGPTLICVSIGSLVCLLTKTKDTDLLLVDMLIQSLIRHRIGRDWNVIKFMYLFCFRSLATHNYLDIIDLEHGCTYHYVRKYIEVNCASFQTTHWHKLVPHFTLISPYSVSLIHFSNYN